MSTTSIKALASQPYRTVTLPLDTATNGYTMNKSGIHIWLLQASDANVTLTVSIGQADAETKPWRPGQGVRHWPYDRVWLSWPAQPGKWVEMAVAGSLEDWDPKQFEVIPPIPAGDVQVTNTTAQAVPVSLQSVASGNLAVDIAAQSGGAINVAGSVSVTGSVNADTRAREWAIPANMTHQALNSATSNALIYTVPTGKVLAVTASSLASSGTGTYSFLAIQNAASVEVIRWQCGLESRNGVCNGLLIPAGYKIYGGSSGGYTCNISITGELRNA